NQLDQTTDSWAVFGQSTWNMTDTTRLTFGLRYTEEDKGAYQLAHAGDFVERNKEPSLNPLVNAISQTVLEFTNHSFNPSDPGMTRNEDSLTWSLNMQHNLSKNNMIYASASTGFKAGGYNSWFMGQAGGLGADSLDASFDEEEVLTYELGSKMLFLRGAAEVNVAYFHMKYDDLQAAIFNGNTSFVVQNAAKATSQGVEIDARWRATENITFAGSLGWVDFKFDEFPNQACTSDQFIASREAAYQAALNGPGGVPEAAGVSLLYIPPHCSEAGVNDLKGRTSANTPEYQANLLANYFLPLGSYDLDFTLNLNWSDTAYRQDDLDPIALSDELLTVNLTIVLGNEEGLWDVALIGKNITDEVSSNWSNDTPLFPGSHDYTMNPPRSFELRARMHF
ncbi:MAG: hypothetical protein DRQ47_06335, partial [Gammaproteobacteria bacterium]